MRERSHTRREKHDPEVTEILTPGTEKKMKKEEDGVMEMMWMHGLVDRALSPTILRLTAGETSFC